MNPATKLFLLGAALVLGAVAASAQTGTQENGQAAAQTTVQAGKAQASGGTSASTSAATSASSPASSGSSHANAGLASGTAFNAALNAPLDSKKSKPGDAVTAHTTENVKSEGKIVLPKGSKLLGHVTKASARAKGDAESELAIVFDRAILKNGEEVPLHVAIQAMAAAQTAASAPDADLDAVGSAGAGATGSGTLGSRGNLGGVTSAAGSVTNTVGGAGDAVLRSTASSTASVAGTSRNAVGGLNATGQLTSDSRGVFSMNGLNLNSVASTGTEGSVITSAGKNVHLDSGTRMLMVTQTTASTTPNP